VGEPGRGCRRVLGRVGCIISPSFIPTRAELADALRRVLSAGIPLEGASDRGVSEPIYMRDPDGNGVELYWDRPKEQWPHTQDGKLAMVTESLDLEQLLRERTKGSVSDANMLEELCLR
jgi:catechol 2,3-dioxygenase